MTRQSRNPDFTFDNPACTGILMINLGTPDAPTISAVRRFLADFLSDPRVIEVPKLLWWMILHGIILCIRPYRSAKAYQKIWTENGSPLLDTSKKQAAAIQDEIKQRSTANFKIVLAMRYGNPSLEGGLEKLRGANAQRILILPLYPQYSATTTASTFDAVSKVLKNWRWLPELRLINHYYNDPDYIHALAESVQSHWDENGRAEKLLFSFHGIPKQYADAGDPYPDECKMTARLVADKLQLKDAEWLVSFQSRFGPREWLKPYTDFTLKKWGGSGILSVDVVCPGFAADCLETLEEINMRNRAFFLEAGGERFSYIPALNDRPSHIKTLVKLILKHCRDWTD
ncbi:MAG: ferrochelatase [Gammaproteobacteria bacterium]|nr:ferrochelatase [Gammaproteobacteria bacterium]